MRAFLPAVVGLAVASCGSGATDAQQGTAAMAKLSLTSSAFLNGQPIPTEYTCDGAGRSPALSWGEPPRGTRSFALVVDDTDAPSGTFGHWGAYDIPVGTRSIATGQAAGAPAVNDLGKPGYGGPCPPKGHGPHHYRFKLFALDVQTLGLAGSPKVSEVEAAAGRHALGRGELVGIYERR